MVLMMDGWSILLIDGPKSVGGRIARTVTAQVYAKPGPEGKGVEELRFGMTSWGEAFA
jgi:hypothetical protein